MHSRTSTLILLATTGNLLKVLAHAATIGERAGSEKLLLKISEKLWTRLEKILADGGNENEAFQAWVEDTVKIEFEISLRPTGLKGFVMFLFAGSSNALSLGWAATVA
jgi:hypothetical protein